MLIVLWEASLVRDKTKRVLNMRAGIINAADPDLLTTDAPYLPVCVSMSLGPKQNLRTALPEHFYEWFCTGKTQFLVFKLLFSSRTETLKKRLHMILRRPLQVNFNPNHRCNELIPLKVESCLSARFNSRATSIIYNRIWKFKGWGQK